MPDPLCRASVRRAQTPLPILLPASIPAPAPQGHPGKHKVVPSLVWSLSMRPGTRSNEQSRKQAERKANKRKQLRKLVSHSCASQPKSKEGGSCKGHWKNSSDVICPHRARLAQREKKISCLQAGQASLVVGAHKVLGSAASATPRGAPTPPAWLWPQSPLHSLVALAGELLLRGKWAHISGHRKLCAQHACARSLHTHHLHVWQAPTELRGGPAFPSLASQQG